MEGWEDQIDIDDSDLQFDFRPHLLPSSSSLPQALPRCLHPCSQIPRSSQNLEPNPSVPPQSQLPTHISEKNQNEEEEHFPVASTSRPLIPGPAGAVQKAMRRQSATAAAKRSPSEAGGRDAGDLCVSEEDGDFTLNPWLYSLSFLGKGTNSCLPYPISSINAQRSATERIPQVVGIIKSCTPNGLGDLFITLKDPTGTIGAVIHRKVLSEGNIGGEISVGCVFILKQVVAFCPPHSPCYLNITLKNVVKLIAKDCGPPEKHSKPPFPFMYGAEGNVKQLQTELPAGEGWLNTRKTADVEPRIHFTGDRATDSRNTFLPESLSGSIFAAAAASAKNAAKLETRRGEPKRLISRASVAEWTDEQVEKLFSDYDDDVELVRPAI